MSDKLKKNLIGAALGIGLPLVLFLLVLVASGGRVKFSQLFSMMTQAILPAILGWGVMCECKTGIWDFSVGANVLVCQILAGNIAKNYGLGVIGVIVIAPLIGLVIGFLMGQLLTRAKIPSIIVSVGAMLLLESASQIMYNGNGIHFGKSILVLSTFPNNLIYGLVCALLAYLLYSQLPYGYQVRLIGNNISIAKNSGVDVNKVRIKIFAVTGLFCGLYAALDLGNSGIVTSKSNMASMGIIFSAIICVFIAQSLEKYINLVLGTFVGALIAAIIRLAIMITGGSNSFQNVYMGLLLIAIFAVQANGHILIEKVTKRFENNGKRDII